LNTVFSVLKLLLLRGEGNRPGLFEIWCERSGQRSSFRDDFTLHDVLRTLPVFTTTGAYEDRAIMHISTEDHGVLKANYERLFEAGWPDMKRALAAEGFPMERWEIFNYEGTVTRRGAGNRDKSGPERGGFKVMLYDSGGGAAAYLWMRGSGTEPVFRVLVDVEGDRPEIEELLLRRHRNLLTEADRAG